MSNFTPGPWTVKTPPMDPNAYDVYGGGTQITRGYWAYNGKANADLIAAAPDLLEALCGLLAWALDDNPGRIADSALASWVDSARDAIAKAEGR